MTIAHYLVIGANRGIGLELVRQLLQKSNSKVVATYRDASKLDDLKKLSLEKPNIGRLEFVRLDMGDDASCKAAAEEVKSRVGSLDVLIANAGINYHDTSLLKQNVDDVAAVFGTNVLGPLRISQHFAPLLSTPESSKKQPSKLIFITSELGSISQGKNGISPSYSVSKAALNMVGRKLSYELEPSKVAVGLFHPGWVQTDMGGSDAPLTAPRTVGGMLKLIDQLNLQNSGEYWQWDGQRIPW
ncbi:C-factor [Ceratobasidium theobromae]|uniref:C-factor n=1 Tax=Ceratobasidium theobromae TaxID=1582974 RepID=A0A5N5QKI2_9AGAM|nr:C-factor [Ceratobasidium theobromae]